MTTAYSSKNTRWRRDNKGHYIPLEQNTQKIEVSVNFENLLETNEVIDSVSTDTTLTVRAEYPYFITGREGNYQLAVMQFDNLDNDLGFYDVAMTVTTNQNRTHKRHFRVEII